MSHKNTPEKFWARLNYTAPGACWEWTGAITSAGYGTTAWHGVRVQAHRVAYALAVGGIDLLTGFRQPGRARTYQEFVLHRCDNRKCCNPAHLFLGSMHDNLLDAYEKARKVQPRSTHANAKMSPDTVRDVRRLYAQGARQVDLAALVGVSQVAISLVVRNETYKDIT